MELLGGRLWLLVLQLLTDIEHSPDAKHREGAQSTEAGKGGGGGGTMREAVGSRSGVVRWEAVAAGVTAAD